MIDLTSASESEDEDQPEAGPSTGGPRQSGRAVRPNARRMEADAAQEEEEEDQEDPTYLPSYASKGKGKVPKKTKKRQMDGSDDEDADRVEDQNDQRPPPSSSRKGKGRRREDDSEAKNLIGRHRPSSSKRTKSGHISTPRRYAPKRTFRDRRPWPPADADRRPPARFQKETEAANWIRQTELLLELRNALGRARPAPVQAV